MSTRRPVSVLVHTFNEIEQIEECLRSVEWADEIYLLDSFSTDGTIEFVRERFPRVKIEQRESLGSASQKNYGMDRVEHDWVLVVDADERVTPELQREIGKVLTSEPAWWGYSIGRRNFILGEPIRFSGLQRDRVTRLFHRRHARYPNRRVHAELIVDGPVARLRGKLLHNYVRSFDHMIAKMTRYGSWGATQLFIDGRRANGMLVLLHPLVRFLRDYFLYLGILDGTRGLVVVGMHVYYTFWKYAKLWEFTRLEKLGRPVPLAELDRNQQRWARPWESATK